MSQAYAHPPDVQPEYTCDSCQEDFSPDAEDWKRLEKSQRMIVLSIRTTARMLDLSTDTVRRLIARGDLASFKIGRMVRVDAAGVERLLRRIPQAEAQAR